MKKSLFLALLVLGFGVLVFFFKLGSLPLLDPDEPRYAGTAYEMMQTGDWINPQFNGESRWDKPILFYWLILWSYSLFGFSEWSARFPSAIFSILNLLLVFFLAYRNRYSGVGWRAVLILATSIEFFVIGRLAVTDMALCFFESLALVIAFECWRSGQGRFMMIAYVACALAVLTKGPVGFLLPAVTFFIFLVLTKNLSFLKKAKIPSGLIVFSLIALPWYVIESFLYKDFFQYFFILHNVKRFATDSLKHGEPVFYHLGTLVIGSFPWCFFLPRAFWRTFRLYWKEPLFLFLLTWFLVQFVFFSISKAKLPTYILPVFLPLSFFIGRFWEDLVQGLGSKGLRVESCILTFFVMSILGVGAYFWVHQYPQDFVLFIWGALPILIGILLVLILSFFVKPRWVFKSIVASFLVGFLSILTFLGPRLGQTKSTKEFAVEIQAQTVGVTRVASFMIFRPSLVYYLKHRVELIRNTEDLKSFLSSSAKVFCMMNKSDYDGFEIEGLFPEVILIKELVDRVLVTNRVD